MALSKRLSAIIDVVDSGYDENLGLLLRSRFVGIELLQQDKAPLIHFVDIVPELMQALNDKLERFATKSNADVGRYIAKMWQ